MNIHHHNISEQAQSILQLNTTFDNEKHYFQTHLKTTFISHSLQYYNNTYYKF